jgi:hypothetical protein
MARALTSDDARTPAEFVMQAAPNRPAGYRCGGWEIISDRGLLRQKPHSAIMAC